MDMEHTKFIRTLFLLRHFLMYHKLIVGKYGTYCKGISSCTEVLQYTTAVPQIVLGCAVSKNYIDSDHCASSKLMPVLCSCSFAHLFKNMVG